MPRRSAASSLLLVRLGEERGLPAEVVLQDTDLSLTDLQQPGAEVADADELAIIGSLVRGCDDPGLGLAAGTRYHLTTYGIWGFALASSPTVRSALETGLRFVDLSFGFCRLRVEEDPDEVRLCLEEPDVPAQVRDFVLARDLAGLRTLVAEVTAGSLPLRRVAVSLPVPTDPAAWHQVLGVVPEFGAPLTLAALDPAVLEQPLPQSDELAAATMQAQCRALLDQRARRSGVAGQVRDLVLRDPGAPLTSAEAAAALAVSERSLRRHLAAEGTSYRSLTDEVRQALAEELLRTGGLSVEQVARRLGYAEPASFTHAFTRWKGLSPRAWVRSGRP